MSTLYTVRILKAGSVTVEVNVDDGSTFSDALDIAGIDNSDMGLRFDGSAVEPGDTIAGSGRLILAKGAKGNA